ncbi:glutathione peroxidase [Pseudoalteromonas sp. NZS127_1]|uniref:glutathione peroxidase n=1 Tax=Pseudoalteromonas TaxID=53246 RepID=UPI000425D0CB|nr:MULTISPECIES: glutathione peroxidase [Pseudoalteromonas]MBG9994353.1 glutathione peroxidase [Pseudoalteromonas sp. NZS127_1]MBH0019348.1 glutathione peroxidase [Pseudoalteromonas sp. SWXJ133]MBH0041573.1 glutathione peroxidase [Pseudoalteromonas sp. SWXJZ10B]MBH0045017.1 glutathione peroxidase [Pseudoalteromonas sp. NZS11_1]MBH0049052.1 glutathione peroxidase [Pseudoalteromonas sp. SWYJZ19]
MLKIIIIGLTALLINAPLQAQTPSIINKTSTQDCQDFTNVDIRKLRSKESINLCQFKNKPLLIVNTASNCGFTYQFKGLEALYQQYKEQGLVVLGFPSDDFFQEEDNEKETAKVCFVNYGVTFPMFATSKVRGSEANPIFKYLNEQTSSPNWNFYKYLVSADRKTVLRFNSKVAPNSEQMITAIETAFSDK